MQHRMKKDIAFVNIFYLFSLPVHFRIGTWYTRIHLHTSLRHNSVSFQKKKPTRGNEERALSFFHFLNLYNVHNNMVIYDAFVLRHDFQLEKLFFYFALWSLTPFGLFSRPRPLRSFLLSPIFLLHYHLYPFQRPFCSVAYVRRPWCIVPYMGMGSTRGAKAFLFAFLNGR